MNIIEFIEDERLLNDRSLSPAQKMALKAIYGLPLNEEELGLWGQAAGGRRYAEGQEFFEVDILKGRKSGGTDKILTNVLLFESCLRPPKLSTGERAVSMIVTSEMGRQSGVVYDYCLGKLEHSPALRKLIKGVRGGEIQLSNGCSILIFPANNARVRAPSILVFGGDEFAFWKTEGRSIDTEVLNAARPGLIFEHSKMIKLSTLNRMSGEAWNDHRRYFGVDGAPVLVLKGSTEFFYPGFNRLKLAWAKLKDPVAFEQEYMCNFRADESSMYDPAQVDAAVNFDRPLELPYRGDVRDYFCFVDVAGGGGRDSYAVAIGHKEDERAVVDVVRSRRPKFNPDEVTAQYCDLIKEYHVLSVTGDKFSGDWALNSFAKHGVKYIRSEKSKSEIYLDMEEILNTSRLSIPNKELLVTQLKSLIRKTRSGGRDSVDTDGGQPEDEGNVCAGVAVMVSQKPRYWSKAEQEGRMPVRVSRKSPDPVEDARKTMDEWMSDGGRNAKPVKGGFNPWGNT